MVPTLNIITMAVMALASVALLVVAWIIIWRRTRASFINTLIGMAVFLVCYVIALATSVLGGMLISSPVILTLVLSLRAGLVEEFGRFVAFKWLLKKRKALGDGLMYGLGHGGMEVLLVYTLTMVSNMAFSIMVNTGGLTALLTAAPAQADALNAAVQTLVTASPGLLSVGLVERVIALVLQISLSVIVFCAVRQRKWLYLVLAMALHAVADGVTALYQGGVVGTWAIEGIIGVVAVCVALIAWRIARTYRPPVEGPTGNPPVSPQGTAGNPPVQPQGPSGNPPVQPQGPAGPLPPPPTKPSV